MVTIGAFAAIFKKEENEIKILLIQRDSHTSLKGKNLPGGRLKEGETPEDAVVRETKEETGLVVKDVEKISNYKKKIEGQLLDVAFLFICEIVGGSIKEHILENSGCDWFSERELDNIHVVEVPCDGYPQSRMIVMIRDAFKQISSFCMIE